MLQSVQIAVEKSSFSHSSHPRYSQAMILQAWQAVLRTEPNKNLIIPTTQDKPLQFEYGIRLPDYKTCFTGTLTSTILRD